MMCICDKILHLYTYFSEGYNKCVLEVVDMLTPVKTALMFMYETIMQL